MHPSNVFILSFAQAVALSGVSGFILLGGIIGAAYAPNAALATLPISLVVVGLAVATIPAALLMQKFGRRAGFVGAALVAAAGTGLAAYAVLLESFWLFCSGGLLIGTHGAFVQQYRFAATESVTPGRAGRAVSYVLLGGIAAGYIGPELASRLKDAHPSGLYIGSFLAQFALYIVAAVTLLFFRNTAPVVSEGPKGGRPLSEIAVSPVFIVAALGGATSYAVMSFIMTATPLELHNMMHFSLDDTAWVIQSHVIAMFLPSLFSGYLIERFGAPRIMLTGTGVLGACVMLGVVSSELTHYWAALVLLGIGWNFQFVGATVLLTGAYTENERFKAQATNEFLVFGSQALASLSAGAALYWLGWEIMNLATLPFLAATFLGGVYLSKRRAAVA